MPKSRWISSAALVICGLAAIAVGPCGGTTAWAQGVADLLDCPKHGGGKGGVRGPCPECERESAVDRRRLDSCRSAKQALLDELERHDSKRVGGFTAEQLEGLTCTFIEILARVYTSWRKGGPSDEDSSGVIASSRGGSEEDRAVREVTSLVNRLASAARAKQSADTTGVTLAAVLKEIGIDIRGSGGIGGDVIDQAIANLKSNLGGLAVFGPEFISDELTARLNSVIAVAEIRREYLAQPGVAGVFAAGPRLRVWLPDESRASHPDSRTASRVEWLHGRWRVIDDYGVELPHRVTGDGLRLVELVERSLATGQAVLAGGANVRAQTWIGRWLWEPSLKKWQYMTPILSGEGPPRPTMLPADVTRAIRGHDVIMEQARRMYVELLDALRRRAEEIAGG